MINSRRLLPDDANAYRAIRLEALKNDPDSYGSTYEEESKLPKLIFESYIETQDPDWVVFGAFLDDELIGITTWFLEKRTRLRHRAKIGQVYVRSTHRGKGISKLLLKAVVDNAFSNPEIEAISLELVDGNEAAHRLYMSLGFETYGQFKNYFKTETGYLNQRFMVLYKSG